MGDGTGLADNSMGAALLSNILHYDEPVVLMKEVFQVFKPNRMLAVIHWTYDSTTGLAMESAFNRNSASGPINTGTDAGETTAVHFY